MYNLLGDLSECIILLLGVVGWFCIMLGEYRENEQNDN